MWTSFRQVQAWHQSFFGQPALLLKDDEQWVLGGPLHTGPRTCAYQAHPAENLHGVGRAYPRLW